jgi:hypothetical protein
VGSLAEGAAFMLHRNMNEVYRWSAGFQAMNAAVHHG